MYNDDLKQDFIRDYTDSKSTAKVATAVFNATARFEEQWQGDICTKTIQEIQPAIEQIAGLRAVSQVMMATILREYGRYCVVNMVPGARKDLSDLKIIGLEKIKTQMVSGPTHLKQYLDAVFDPEAEETLDNIYRSYYWLAFSGVLEPDAMAMRRQDLDFHNLQFVYKGKRVDMYKEALPALHYAAELGSFVYKHPLYTKLIRRDRVSGDEILRGVKAGSDRGTMRYAITVKSTRAKKAGLTDLSLSYHRVWLSGYFYRIYENERSGHEVDMTPIVRAHMEGKTYTSVKSKERVIWREYLEDYQRWKLVFGR